MPDLKPKGKRLEIEIKREGNKILATVKALDPIAARSGINTVLKAIIIAEKMVNLVESKSKNICGGVSTGNRL